MSTKLATGLSFASTAARDATKAALGAPTLVADTAARKGAGTGVGAQVVQANEYVGGFPTIRWEQIAADATLDASWQGIPLTRPDGTFTPDLRLADFAGIVPAENALGHVDGDPRIGDAEGTTGGRSLRQSRAIVALAFAATINTDTATGEIFEVGNLTGNITLANPTNGYNRMKVEWIFKQDGTGGSTITLGNKFRIPSSSDLVSPITGAPFTTASKKSRLVAEYDSTDDKWDIVAFIPGY